MSFVLFVIYMYAVQKEGENNYKQKTKKLGKTKTNKTRSKRKL